MQKKSLAQILKEREKKIENFKKEGIYPYSQEFEKPDLIKDVLQKFDKEIGKEKKIAGRIFSKREHGALIFCDIKDGTGKIQGVFQKNILGKKDFSFFKKNFDIGDIIFVKGELFLTKKGERSIKVKKYQILAKSLLPLPEKWHGLKDVEERFRKRYLDLLMSEEVKKKFILRSKIISSLRNFLEKEGFLEVETPILQKVYGGASAKPFKTYLSALDLPLFLRIAPEIYLKKVLIGSFLRIYEIGKNFRNEGIDREHNPEFTFLEFYAAYFRFEDLLKFTERMLNFVVKKVFGKEEISYQGEKISFNLPFQRKRFFDFLKEKTGKDFEKMSLNEVRKIAKKYEIKDIEKKEKARLIDDIFKKERKKIKGPLFLLYPPIELTPLAKALPQNPSLAQRAILIVGGIELVNEFQEENDPFLQEKRFLEQKRLFEKGDEESHPYDKSFVEALKYGMPPACGCGIGIDRLVALLTDSPSIKEVILFPFIKEKN